VYDQDGLSVLLYMDVPDRATALGGTTDSYGVPFVSKLLFESTDGKCVDIQHVGWRISEAASVLRR